MSWAKQRDALWRVQPVPVGFAFADEVRRVLLVGQGPDTGAAGRPPQTVVLPDPLPCDNPRCVGRLVAALLAGDRETVEEELSHDHEPIVWNRRTGRVTPERPEPVSAPQIDADELLRWNCQDRNGRIHPDEQPVRIAEVDHEPVLPAARLGEGVDELCDPPVRDLHGVPVHAQPHDGSHLSWRSIWRRLRTVARRREGGER